jgi:hypothetical protein
MTVGIDAGECRLLCCVGSLIDGSADARTEPTQSLDAGQIDCIHGVRAM